MKIDLTQYRGRCESCGSPARLETTFSDQTGIESFQVCVNPKCWQFDSWLKRKREQLEAAARQSAAAAKHRKKLWAVEISKMNRHKRKQRASIQKMLSGSSAPSIGPVNP